MDNLPDEMISLVIDHLDEDQDLLTVRSLSWAFNRVTEQRFSRRFFHQLNVSLNRKSLRRLEAICEDELCRQRVRTLAITAAAMPPHPEAIFRVVRNMLLVAESANIGDDFRPLLAITCKSLGLEEGSKKSKMQVLTLAGDDPSRVQPRLELTPESSEYIDRIRQLVLRETTELMRRHQQLRRSPLLSHHVFVALGKLENCSKLELFLESDDTAGCMRSAIDLTSWAVGISEQDAKLAWNVDNGSKDPRAADVLPMLSAQVDFIFPQITALRLPILTQHSERGDEENIGRAVAFLQMFPGLTSLHLAFFPRIELFDQFPQYIRDAFITDRLRCLSLSRIFLFHDIFSVWIRDPAFESLHRLELHEIQTWSGRMAWSEVVKAFFHHQNAREFHMALCQWDGRPVRFRDGPFQGDYPETRHYTFVRDEGATTDMSKEFMRVAWL